MHASSNFEAERSQSLPFAPKGLLFDLETDVMQAPERSFRRHIRRAIRTWNYHDLLRNAAQAFSNLEEHRSVEIGRDHR